ncbi:hypothetical protein BT63DRAFT_456674 [Microthyrium microscopicum]|uniref:Heterokaryon incompatibility domain-containing protein n=1 Tax=Microthyrium microscopicum TaxID=703497 RepID=A0A6A6U617_9PEZI|nr:hypothetical protein BT63DRAFT_456674 [Microthyrium microscopicum]
MDNEEEPPQAEVKFSTPENSYWLSKHQYNELNVAEREIRLLKVPIALVLTSNLRDFFPQWMATETDAKQHVNEINTVPRSIVACEIIQCPIDAVQDQYYAISYCAGDAKRTKWILVNGYWFNCFESLERAFRQVRASWPDGNGDSDPFIYVWADQISNEQEKSHQVAFMRDIYHRAKHVYVSLNFPDEQSRFSSSEIAYKKFLDYIHNNDDVKYNLLNPAGFRELAIHMGADGHSLKSLITEIISQPWWTRSWVFQEFLVASRVYFFIWHIRLSWWELSPLLKARCGMYEDLSVPSGSDRDCEPPSRRTKTSMFRKFIPEKLSKPPRKPKDSPSNSSMTPEKFLWSWADISHSHISRVKHFVESKEHWSCSISVRNLMENCHTFSATDPRDRIYAFAGLAQTDGPEEGLLRWLVPDYSVSNTMPKLLCNLALTFFKFNTEHFRFALDAAVLRKRGENGRFNPSWVADWTQAIDSDMLELRSKFLGGVTEGRMDNDPMVLLMHENSKSSVTGIDWDIPEQLRAISDPSGLRLRVEASFIATLRQRKNDSFKFWCDFWVTEDARLAVRSHETAKVNDTLWSICGSQRFHVLRTAARTGGGYTIVAEAALFVPAAEQLDKKPRQPTDSNQFQVLLRGFQTIELI